MSKSMSFRDPIHHVTYFVLIGDIKDFRKEVSKHDNKYDVSDGTAKCISVGKDKILIYLNRLDIPCLSHEAVHAAVMVFDGIGAKITFDTDEHLAYYVQWIVGTIHNHFKPKGFLCKKKAK